MKTTQHEFSLDLYKKAIANPDKYEFVYRNGEKPLGVVYMEGLKSGYAFVSWDDDRYISHSLKGEWFIEKPDNKDLFILEKHAQEPVVVEAEKVEVPKVDQERLDKFVRAAMVGLLSNSVYAETFTWEKMTSTAVTLAKETLKQLEGGEG